MDSGKPVIHPVRHKYGKVSRNGNLRAKMTCPVLWVDFVNAVSHARI